MKVVYPSMRTLLLATTLALSSHFALAQDDSEFDVATPAVMSLQKSMASRFAQLRPHLEAGVIGLTHDGVLAMREASGVDVKVLLLIDVLIQEENKDRTTLYREIARANRRPEWESNLRITFGSRWISRIPSGWFYRNDSGQWLRK